MIELNNVNLFFSNFGLLLLLLLLLYHNRKQRINLRNSEEIAQLKDKRSYFERKTVIKNKRISFLINRTNRLC